MWCACAMRIKMLLVAGGIAGAAGALVALKLRTEGDPKEAMAHRMREHLESMPEEFPPRMMLDNLAATRVNTEKILQILGDQGTPVGAASDNLAADDQV